MCMKTLGPNQVNVVTDSTTMSAVATTEWILCLSVQQVKALVALIAKSSDIQVTPIYQTAGTDTSNPDAWATLESSATWVSTAGNKDCTDTVDLSSITTGKFFIRFGLGFKNAATSTLNRANATVAFQGIS